MRFVPTQARKCRLPSLTTVAISLLVRMRWYSNPALRLKAKLTEVVGAAQLSETGVGWDAGVGGGERLADGELARRGLLVLSNLSLSESRLFFYLSPWSICIWFCG
jgi:hypothetical protein